MLTLSDFIDPQVLRTVLVDVIMGMVVALGALFAVLVAQKIQIERRDHRFRRLRLDYLRRLSLPRPVVPPPHGRSEFEALGAALGERISIARGAEFQELQRLAHRLGVGDFYARRAASMFWSRRLQAMEALAALMLPETRGLMLARLAHEQDIRVLAKVVLAFSALCESTVDITHINLALARLLPTSSKFNEFVYSRCIRSLRGCGQEALFDAALRSVRGDDHFPVLLTRDMIEAAGKERLEAARPTIAAFYRQSGDAVMRVACLRALGHLEALGDKLGEALLDDDWRIRAVAARYGWQGGPSAVPLMKLGMRDENYHVRLNAAQTMIRLGPSGLQALCEEVEGPDTFAREIAYYAMNSGMNAGLAHA
ncbi:MAG TPA: HEAT repeat domain-containing protein [Acidiferrobacteraceae bacterium]|nr:HEAT repeat domain-containing protein [Acidiferrobacteraceae bacterium]